MLRVTEIILIPFKFLLKPVHLDSASAESRNNPDDHIYITFALLFSFAIVAGLIFVSYWFIQLTWPNFFNPSPNDELKSFLFLWPLPFCGIIHRLLNKRTQKTKQAP